MATWGNKSALVCKVTQVRVSLSVRQTSPRHKIGYQSAELANWVHMEKNGGLLEST